MENEINKIGEAIQSYLRSDDDQAFQIDGPWGTGKTYYIQNTAKKLIEENGYRTIYVSLSNMQDLAEIKSEVSVQILATLGTVKQTSYQATKIAANSLELIKNLGFSQAELLKQPAKEFGKKIRDHLLKNIDYKKYLFIFDDLERMSEELGIKQVFGYIASLLEQNHSKVIIISNQDKYDYSDDLADKKEKIINKTISFSGYNYIVAFDLIKKQPFESVPSEQHDDILSLSEKLLISDEDINLRTIKSILSSFKQVSDLLVNSKPSLNSKDLKHSLKVALVSTWILTQAYKRGLIEDVSDCQALLNEYFSAIKNIFANMSSSQDNESKKKNKIRELIEQYDTVIKDAQLNLDILFPESIYYLITADYFCVEDFLSQLGREKEELQHRSKVLPLARTVNMLENIQTDKELIEKEEKLINLIQAPDSDLDDLIRIYQCFMNLQDRKLPVESNYPADELLASIEKKINRCDVDQLTRIMDNFVEWSREGGFRKKIKSLVESRQNQLNDQGANKMMQVVLDDEWKSNMPDLTKFSLSKDISLFQLLNESQQIKNGTFSKAKPIQGLSHYLSTDIIQVSNADEFHQNEIEPAKQFLKDLTQYKDSLDDKHHLVLIYKLSELEKVISQSITHLQKRLK
ncbi:P-loop NTPase fold protein [Oenococcus alcoholitolerans]|uniref:P-loop NTPase fold protein n=1 Tax=Oenococcus alcoholitolerans TaxID=931074 RepID=UPI003F6F1639